MPMSRSWQWIFKGFQDWEGWPKITLWKTKVASLFWILLHCLFGPPCINNAARKKPWHTIYISVNFLISKNPATHTESLQASIIFGFLQSHMNETRDVILRFRNNDFILLMRMYENLRSPSDQITCSQALSNDSWLLPYIAPISILTIHTLIGRLLILGAIFQMQHHIWFIIIVSANGNVSFYFQSL